MADNKNMELNDEMMAKATGGNGVPSSENKFNVGDTVHWQKHEDWGEGVVTSMYWQDITWIYTVSFASIGEEVEVFERGLY